MNAINVNDKVEKKNNLTYLAWAYAWGEVKKNYPDATYTIYENAQGWNYHTDGRTCWVKTGVTIGGQEYIEYLPVMNHANKSIQLEQVTSFDVNKAIQRSLTKACARHGLGLYIYAGEDLPEDEAAVKRAEQEAAAKPKTKKEQMYEDNVQDALDEIKQCNTVEDLKNTYKHYPMLISEKSFISALSARKKEILS